MRTINVFSLLFILVLVSCVNEPNDNDNNNNITIKTGTSFGFCGGYCSLEATITESKIEFISSSWDTIKYPTRTENILTGKDKWEVIENNLNIDQFEKLDEVIGCPDCADGGSEWIEITTDEINKKVTFEYGDSLDGMNELLKILREIRNKYTEEQSSDNINYGVYYSNSFESINDTAGWENISEEMLKYDPAPNFGLKSLYVGGGCVQPAASIILKTLPDGPYYISFWAKIEIENLSGSITLSNGSNEEPLPININNKYWKYFEAGPVIVKPNFPLKIDIIIGGIIPAYMFIDNLKVYTIN